MIIILEGPRNSGKSTAAHKLKEAIGDSYLIKFQRTSKPSPPIFMTEFLSRHWLALIDSRSVAILDRFHLTEFVMRTLDKGVDPKVLAVTTHMIDVQLKNCGSITYVLETDRAIRDERYKFRDLEHRQREWPRTSELDAAWLVAKKTFKSSIVKSWSGNTQSDIDALVKDAASYVSGGKLLNESIAALPPRLEVNELVADVV